MAQGPMDHDRISKVEKALDEHKELTREQFRDILRRIDAEQTRRDADARELRTLIENRSAEGHRRLDDAMARIDRKFDRQTVLILTSWLTTMGTLLYLHFR